MASIAEPCQRSSAETGAKPYYADLDVARGVLMALGIVLHTANLFYTGIFERYTGSADGYAFRYLAEAIHLFRMPAFFAVSGFFCAMSLRRHDVRRFLGEKRRRILIPLVFVLLALNPIDIWLRTQLAHPPCADAGSIFCGNVLLHLWFLVVVCIYFMIAALVAALISRLSDTSHNRALDALSAINGYPRIALGVWVTAALFLSYLPHALGTLAPTLTYTRWLMGVSPFTVLEYATFFIFGAWLNFSPALSESWRRFSWSRLVLFVASVTIVAWLGLSETIDPNLMIAARAAGAWICVLTIFGLFAQALRWSGVDSKHFAEPAYTIYLLHHVLVLLLGWAIMAAGFGGWPAFAFIVASVLLITLFAHYAIVRKVPLLRFLLNGK